MSREDDDVKAKEESGGGWGSTDFRDSGVGASAGEAARSRSEPPGSKEKSESRA